MKKFILFIFAVGLLSFAFTSCTAPIDIDTKNSEPVIVITSMLTDEYKTQEVHISRSSPYFSNEENAAVSGAVVKITTSGNQTYEFSENPSVPGLYQANSKWAAQIGTTYSLRVEVDFNSDGKKRNL